MTMIESRAAPDGIVLRNDAGEEVFNSAWPMMAFLGNWAGGVEVGGWSGPATGYDSPHLVDHDVGAAPIGTTHLLAFIDLNGIRTEFSGSVQIVRLTYRRDPTWARIVALEWWLAPVIVGGRIKIRERWWYHGANGAELAGWPSGSTIAPRTYQYDIRAVAFVGGV